MAGTKLLPCPFCGGKAKIARDVTCGYETFWAHCLECHSQANYGHTEAEAIEAWNTRADDYRHAAEYWQRMYEESFTERTCEEFGSLRIWQECYVWSHDLSCGHEVDTLDMEPPNYCPNCGAKVVEE